jgi:hypothetical protein
VNMQNAAEGKHAPSHRHSLHERRAYWATTMHTMGMICTLTLSVMSGGFRMDWDPPMGPASPNFLRNRPSAVSEEVFVADAIATMLLASLPIPCGYAPAMS